ncbi:MAG: hypothetical protein AWM53_01288 [Candidatus Dichloromethanomonas elyunquensis]|nr:MAG: hypothetical protein AWM53_01288 [Candidatus Dichloromethanomonas elyunquensis]
MFTEKRISRFLAVALVTFIVATQAIFIGTAAFAENREKESQQEINIWDTAAYKEYHKEDIDKLAKEYQVEPNYLYYIAEVETAFNLEPYELFSLIYLESKFVPQTIMDGGSFSYNTTQMKLATAMTAYMAITQYYQKNIPYPTHDLLKDNKYYATLLAGGYLRYLHDTYKDRDESYTAYRMGINGRLAFFRKNGNYKSSYALRLEEVRESLTQGNTKI